MLDLDSPLHAPLLLENGLRLRLGHDPRLKRSAAFLRVAAGSHDAPVAWPGLAHFLEHMFFLGTSRFSDDQSFMAFVRRHGGQLNASTAERHTDFFFEIPPAAFQGALDRLCDMLTYPRMSQAEQLREREVLHAEFVAWSQDAESRHHQWLCSGLAAEHPLRAFHAGNRYSLPVPREAFQRNLREFYRRYYQTGQMTLCLVGPQSLDELRQLAQTSSQCLPQGKAIDRPPAPPLLGDPIEPSSPIDPTRLDLLFACEHLPEGIDPALAFLGTWLENPQAGGLLAELRRLGWVDTLTFKTWYRFAGQVVVNLQCQLTEAGQAARDPVAALCFSWLEFFQSHDDWQSLREEYALLKARRLQVAGALEQARHSTERFTLGLFAGLCPTGLAALRALLPQLTPARLVQPLPGAAAWEGHTELPVQWRLPARNRFLRASRRPSPGMLAPPSMKYQSMGGPAGLDAALLLRWRLENAQPRLWQLLDDNLRKLVEEGRQAGVQVQLSSLGDDWLLKMDGIQSAMPALLEALLHALASPDQAVWRQAAQQPAVAKHIAIRELLKRLPERCLNLGPQRDMPGVPTPQQLQHAWQTARWDGLALGLGDEERNAVNAVLRNMPGKPCSDIATPPPPLAGKHWQRIDTPSSEHALLLFCPVPTGDVVDEAAWRLLGHLCQAPFYQRLRVEQQLGYAVFSDFRQVAGRGGLLFGVQSPSHNVTQILEHIATFVGDLPDLIKRHDLGALNDQALGLGRRLHTDDMEPGPALEALWQSGLAGHDADHIGRLSRTLVALHPQRLLDAARHLSTAAGGWLCLANQQAPSADWQTPA